MIDLRVINTMTLSVEKCNSLHFHWQTMLSIAWVVNEMNVKNPCFNAFYCNLINTIHSSSFHFFLTAPHLTSSLTYLLFVCHSIYSLFYWRPIVCVFLQSRKSIKSSPLTHIFIFFFLVIKLEGASDSSLFDHR
jgi:hypothetical protein